MQAGFHLISQNLSDMLVADDCANTVANFNESVPQSADSSNSTAGLDGERSQPAAALTACGGLRLRMLLMHATCSQP